jgi:hypothetical protein
LLAIALASFGIGTTEFVITGLDSAGPARIDGRLGVDAGTDLRHGRPDGSAAKRGEALSDDGSVTGRGSSLRRGAITGFGTGLGGMFHTLPIPVSESGCRVVCKLLTIAFIRYRFMGGKLANTIVQVILGSGIVFAIGVGLGRIGAG